MKPIKAWMLKHPDKPFDPYIGGIYLTPAKAIIARNMGAYEGYEIVPVIITEVQK